MTEFGPGTRSDLRRKLCVCGASNWSRWGSQHQQLEGSVEGACFWGALCDGGVEFTLSPNVTVGAEDHGVHNVLANWTRQQVVSPGSRHGQRAWADIQGVCKHGDA